MVKVTDILLGIILFVILLLAAVTILSGVFPSFQEGVEGFKCALKLVQCP